MGYKLKTKLFAYQKHKKGESLMNTNYEKNNIAHISGEVKEEPKFSHFMLGEGFYDIAVEVPRLSQEFDSVPVTISERLLENIKTGDKISIDGQFRSYNKLEDGRSKLILTLFAKELTDFDESINPNTITLTGFLCKKPIYRTTPFGREICDILVAVNRAYNKSDYIPCIAWGRNARFVSNLEVGQKITLHGRIQSRMYQKKHEDKPAENKIAYEVSISSIAICDDNENNENFDESEE